MNRARPNWKSVGCTLAAVAAAGVLGYQAEAQRLKYRQNDDLTRLCEALRQTSGLVTECIQNAVRAPRWAISCDTLYIATASPVAVTAVKRPDPAAPVWILTTERTEAPRVWLDSCCSGAGYRVHNGTSVAIAQAGSPGRVWVLEHHALYVDKAKGGLWIRHDRRPPERLARLVDQFRVEPDSSAERGFSLGLSGTWQVTNETAVRRSVYRYVAAEERWEG